MMHGVRTFSPARTAAWLFAAADAAADADAAPVCPAAPAGRLAVGGQAVIEGIMMRSPNAFAVAVRRPDGRIAVREERWRGITARFPILNRPPLRGAVVLLESLFNGMSALTWAAEQAAPTDEKGAEHAAPPSWMLALTVAVSLAAGIAIFKFVPHLTATGLFALFERFTGVAVGVRDASFHLLDGVLRLGVLVGYMAAIGRIPELARVFAYHGAEHKSIAAFEDGAPLEVAEARARTRFHRRCGTSFLLIVVLVSTIVFAAVGRFLPALTGSALLDGVLFMFIKVPLLLPIAGISYEVIRWSAREGGPAWLRGLTLPGLWLQRITTREPDDDQLEVALCALRSTLLREAAGATAGDGLRLRVVNGLGEIGVVGG